MQSFMKSLPIFCTWPIQRSTTAEIQMIHHLPFCNISRNVGYQLHSTVQLFCLFSTAQHPDSDPLSLNQGNSAHSWHNWVVPFLAPCIQAAMSPWLPLLHWELSTVTHTEREIVSSFCSAVQLYYYLHFWLRLVTLRNPRFLNYYYYL